MCNEMLTETTPTFDGIDTTESTPAPAPTGRTFKTFSVRSLNTETSLRGALQKKFKDQPVELNHFHGSAQPNHTYVTSQSTDYILKSAVRVSKGSRYFVFKFVQVV